MTLHVGAGTFKPVKSNNISEHEMHCEHFFVAKETIELLLKYKGSIIPVGTTSVRTLESLYWLGIKLGAEPDAPAREVFLGQWEAYEYDSMVPMNEALEGILMYMKINRYSRSWKLLQAS